MNTTSDLLRTVAAAYGHGDAAFELVEAGHINRTYLVRTRDAQFVMQWVNPIFSVDIHQNIEAVTQHLAGHGLATPRLVRNLAGQLYTVDAERGVWRLMTHIPGEVHDVARDAKMCRSAGGLVARFHRVVQSLTQPLIGTRSGVHDTAAHLTRLAQAIEGHAKHTAFAQIAPVATAILDHARTLATIDHLPQRIVHGDLKLSNIVFSPTGEAHCLIDLDTLGHMPLAVELGDAWRSWCNRFAEDNLASTIDLDLFAGAVRGYAGEAGDLLSAGEREHLVAGIETIATELAARFCRDAFEERYFGWDRSRYPSAWAHNLQRARSQLNLAHSIAAVRSQAESLVTNAFRSRR